MSEFIASLGTDLDVQLQSGYIACCLILVLIVFAWPAWRRSKRHKHGAAMGEGGEEAVQANPKSKVLTVLEGPGSGAILHMLILAATAICALIGWRIPAEIERIYGEGAGFGLIFPNVTMPTIGKLAQVIGAVTLGLVCLRLLRLIVPLISVVLLALLTLLAIEYVTGVPLLGIL